MPLLPQTETLLLEPADGWLTIWLNRPEVRNALSNDMVSELRAVLEAVSSDRSIRGITFRGKGDVFCAGGDLAGFKAMFHGERQNADDVVQSSRAAGEVFGLVDTMPQVVVMLVHGAAMAGGLGLVCAGDAVAVTQDARFALTETTLGIPPAQIAPFVVARLGLRTARRIMLTAARFDGEQARALGLADEVVPDASALDAFEQAIRKGVMRCAPQANAVTKELVHAACHLDRAAMVDKAAADFAKCMVSDEAKEGIAAFFEKRKPGWVPSK